MKQLSDLMQDRLDKWRKNTLPVASKTKLIPETASRRGGKGDYGDVISLEQWEQEALKSQTRK